MYEVESYILFYREDMHNTLALRSGVPMAHGDGEGGNLGEASTWYPQKRGKPGKNPLYIHICEKMYQNSRTYLLYPIKFAGWQPGGFINMDHLL